jgi:hypothetical protein
MSLLAHEDNARPKVPVQAGDFVRAFCRDCASKAQRRAVDRARSAQPKPSAITDWAPDILYL